MRKAWMDFDTRRQPKTDRWCVCCQRDINPGSQARTVRILDFPWVLHPEDAGVCGEVFLVGLDCARKIGIEFTLPETKR
ncbi:MAG: hypothetical protein WC047_00445 [Kiritimatiellales bacterium]